MKIIHAAIKKAPLSSKIVLLYHEKNCSAKR